MAAIIAPSICRFTVEGEYFGEQVANILDMHIDTTGGTTSRTDGIFDVAGDILNNWSDHILPNLVDHYKANRVAWVDLDSSSGDVGERSSTSAETWPQSGLSTDSPMPGNVAALVRKQIVGTRGRRSGRMYLCGVSEGRTAAEVGNYLAANEVTTWNTALASFLSGINDAVGGALDVQRKLVVVHTQRPTPDADPVYNGYTDVESLTMNALLATQRRRLR